MRVVPRAGLAALVVLAMTVPVAAFQTATPQDSPEVKAQKAKVVAKLQSDYEAKTTARPMKVPEWAYPPSAVTVDDNEPHHLPGSTKTYSFRQVEGTAAVDWYPDKHPKAPTAVMDGKKEEYHGCGLCHLMNGYGKPDMQSLNGLSVGYMEQQLADMKNDLRHSTIAFGDVVHMNHVAKLVPEADAKDAIEYFHSIGPANPRWTRVVESASVPKFTRGRRSLAEVDPSGAMEPLGNRVIEIPENYERSALRDPTSGFVAYVPVGSLKKGETLVKTGADGRTMACVSCHGAALRGMGDTFPPLAGRSAAATGRQLYDYKSGARHGTNSALMKPVVENLTDEDIVDISAYLVSLPQ